MKNLDLFDQPPPQEPPRTRSTDPGTSHAGEAKVKPRVTKLRYKILRVLSDRGSLTTLEMADRTGEYINSITPRMRPLADDGFVEQVAERKSAHGVRNIVWGITAAGRDALREVEDAASKNRV